MKRIRVMLGLLLAGAVVNVVVAYLLMLSDHYSYNDALIAMILRAYGWPFYSLEPASFQWYYWSYADWHRLCLWPHWPNFILNTVFYTFIVWCCFVDRWVGYRPIPSVQSNSKRRASGIQWLAAAFALVIAISIYMERSDFIRAALFFVSVIIVIRAAMSDAIAGSQHDPLHRGLWLLQWAMALQVVQMTVPILVVSLSVYPLWLLRGQYGLQVAVLILVAMGVHGIQRGFEPSERKRTRAGLVLVMLYVLVVWHRLFLADGFAREFGGFLIPKGPLLQYWIELVRALVWFVVLLGSMHLATKVNEQLSSNRLSEERILLILGVSLLAWISQVMYDQAHPYLGAQFWGMALWWGHHTVLMGWAILLWFVFRGARKRTLNDMKCAICGYDLRGADHEQCPECGTAVRKASPA